MSAPYEHVSQNDNRAPIDIRDKLASFNRAMRVEDVSALLNIAPKTVYRLASKNVLPSFKVGASLRFNPSALAKWLGKV
jgi:excisionase family DNA binding protein